MRQLFIISSIISLFIIALISFFLPVFLYSLILLLPVIAAGIYDMYQTQHTLWRNYPLMAHWRWIMEALRGAPHAPVFY